LIARDSPGLGDPSPRVAAKQPRFTANPGILRRTSRFCLLATGHSPLVTCGLFGCGDRPGWAHILTLDELTLLRSILVERATIEVLSHRRLQSGKF